MNYLLNKKGSSSVLVIVLIVVLMLFGIAVLTTTLSNVRLSDKKKSWAKEYYELEGQLEEKLAEYDEVLLKVGAETYSTFKTIKLPLFKDTQDYKNINSMFKEMYLENLEKEFGAVNSKDDYVSFSVDTYTHEALYEMNKWPNPTLTFEVSDLREEQAKHIEITIAILKPDEAEELIDENCLRERYKILSYYEWQEGYELEEGIKFEDPF